MKFSCRPFAILNECFKFQLRFFYGILLALVIVLANAKKRSTCREPTVFKNFDLDGILGLWYEYSRSDIDFEAGCDCTTLEFTAIDAHNIQILTCCQMIGGSNETQTCDIGVNKVTHTGFDTNENNFTYTRVGSTIESPTWIIDTDYDNYFIADGCDLTSNDEDKDVLWIFSRDKQITENEVRKINKVLEDNNFDSSKIIKQRHGADLCTSKPPKNARKNLHRRRHHSHDGN